MMLPSSANLTDIWAAAGPSAAASMTSAAKTARARVRCRKLIIFLPIPHWMNSHKRSWQSKAQARNQILLGPWLIGRHVQNRAEEPEGTDHVNQRLFPPQMNRR